MNWFKKLIDAISKLFDKPNPPTNPDKPTEPPAEGRKWRRDVVDIKATDGRLTFYTRNLTVPTGDGRNKDGGFEWIISRVYGDGYERLLIMVMGGDRPPSRIWFDGDFKNSLWKMPLIEEAKWEVYGTGLEIILKLNGNIVWSKPGSFTVRGGYMNGYRNRESTGEWAV